MLAKLLALIGPVLAFVVANKAWIVPVAAGIGLCLAAVLAVYLPTATFRAHAVIVLAFGSFVAGLAAPKGVPFS